MLLSKILPALVTIVDLEAKRTVLAHAAVDASFELIELAAKTTVLVHILQMSGSNSSSFTFDFD